MSDYDKYMRGEDAPDRFRLIIEMDVEVTDWEKLRDRELAMQTDETGVETVSVPPTRFWSNAASLISGRLWAGDNSGAEGLRILSSSTIPRFPDENGTVPEFTLPEM
ncbi:hypothetical protein SAMN05660766_2250 [Curtobacterium sp. 314Chir4.1]|uniref:hypothetical protein n=1 Tax=Curtobacterium sp. 314Chir4.1 TaxID=1279028 RepID=UPI000BD2AD56|nr:hypothetical protein [Curtobacterium sp. 314Chir4.1]SOC88543.1 hypothetical protein SAMN05660766_2250 [Curtobacterium sp. 314Chir4.1]